MPFTISDIDVKGAANNFGVRHQTFETCRHYINEPISKVWDSTRYQLVYLLPFDDIRDYLGKLYIEIVNNEDKSSPFSDLILQSLTTFDLWRYLR